MSKPLILISNDDGIDAKGIHALAKAVVGLAELYLVAPASEKSAVGHAITVRDPLRAEEREFLVEGGEVTAWAVPGTPADCVKLGVAELLPRRPDLVISGINRGSNAAVNAVYSGTVSAASEAIVIGIPGVAFSLCSFRPGMDYEVAGQIARQIVIDVLKNGLPAGVLLNINIPDLPAEKIKGNRVTRMAHARWVEEYSARKDPMGQSYYWLTGNFTNLDTGDDENDLAALDEGYVAITPLHLDLTAYNHIKTLKTIWPD